MCMGKVGIEMHVLNFALSQWLVSMLCIIAIPMHSKNFYFYMEFCIVYGYDLALLFMHTVWYWSNNFKQTMHCTLQFTSRIVLLSVL